MTLTFDAGPHIYRWNGVEVPSVTTIIKPFSDDKMRFIDPAKLALARDKGIANHKLVELYMLGKLARVPAWQEGVLSALERFTADWRFVMTSTEKRLYHGGMAYAGTPDLTGWMRGRHGVVDVKRSLIGGRTIGLQLSGYKRLIEAQGGFEPESASVKGKWALILNEDGTYEVIEYADPRDDAAFLAALTLWKWQRQGVN